jgi:hypothetical protein
MVSFLPRHVLDNARVSLRAASVSCIDLLAAVRARAAAGERVFVDIHPKMPAIAGALRLC